MRPSHILSILDREFTSAAELAHTPVMLWGPPGVGKSQIIAQIARRHDVPLVDIRLSQMEPTDLRGIPFRVGDLVEWSVPALLPNAERHGERGILFLDEITSAPPTVTAAAYQLILDRRLGDYRVPRGWVIFAAGNRYGDRGVTYAMPSPLANRFTHYEIEPHLEDWVAWAHSARIDERLIDDMIQPSLPWRALLARFLASMARDDYSYQRPSRREGPAVLPRLASSELNLLVAIDTSGSISNDELARFVGEIDALKGQVRARVVLHACDEVLDPAGPWLFQPWEPIALPRRVRGSGGTSFIPVFDWVAREQARPDLLLYFTDGEGEFPAAAPDYPVIWLVKGRAPVPWGERIQLN